MDLYVPTPDIEPEGCILMGWRGSIAHGIYLDPNDPSSVDDKDLMGIVIAPLECYFGNKEWGSRGTKEIKLGDWDVVHYEIKKMMSLLLQGNPNVVSLLWMKPDFYLTCKPAGQSILGKREIFSSKKMWTAFEGYAWGQHARMKRGEFKGHMGAKRKDLFDKYGYDCKAAAHMIRLVRMAAEFYEQGKLHVWRDDYPELLTIKKGSWSLERVETEFAQTIERASAACKASNLPQEPMHEEAQDLLQWILCDHFHAEVESRLG
jgi:predicted nucleotidyltransferase